MTWRVWTLSFFIIASCSRETPSTPTRNDTTVIESNPKISESLDTAGVDPYIVQVLSGGHWKNGDTEGNYRLIVYQGGFEHVVTNMKLESISIIDGVPKVYNSIPVEFSSVPTNCSAKIESSSDSFSFIISGIYTSAPIPDQIRFRLVPHVDSYAIERFR